LLKIFINKNRFEFLVPMPTPTSLPVAGNCGQVMLAKSVLVIGGVNAKPGAWPWQVRFSYTAISIKVVHEQSGKVEYEHAYSTLKLRPCIQHVKTKGFFKTILRWLFKTFVIFGLEQTNLTNVVYIVVAIPNS
jgi:hypothetical protein